MGNYDRYANANGKDKRLGKRTVKVLEQLSAEPDKSVCQACGGKGKSKAAYRLLANQNFSDASVLSIQRQQTIERVSAAECSIVLIAEDTTTLEYNGLKETEGIGPISDNPKSRGILVHSALAIAENGQPLGLLAQKTWARKEEEYGKKKERKKEPIESKESYKWIEVMNEAEFQEEGITTIHVCDRESDIYEFFAYAKENKSNFLCRRTYNRVLEDEDMKINEYMRQADTVGRIVIEIPRDSHVKRPAREAELSIKYSKVIITRPINLNKTRELCGTIELYAITAKEENPPEGVAPVSWDLFTNMEISSFEEAVKYIGYYTQRWLIERFHYVLKSGCNIESAQLKSVQGLFNLESLYSVIAIEILYTTYLARTEPNAECTKLFDENEWKILYCVVNETKTPPESPPTILEAIVLLARLGGFLARKNDGFPGVKVLWTGISKYRTIIAAAPFLKWFVGKE
jgi:hypothetical protein